MDNEKYIRNLYSAVESALFFGDRLSSAEFAVLMQPGQFVSPTITESGPPSNAMAIQSTIANQLIDTSFIYKELLGSVNETYREVLENMALPHRELTIQEEREVRTINQWLAANTSTYRIYEDRYYAALAAYETEQNSESPSDSRLLRLARKRDDALRSWTSVGLKREWENKQARVDYLQAGNPEAWRGELLTKFQGQVSQSPGRGEYLKTFLVPPVSEWNSAATSWASYEKTISESDFYSYSHSTSWSAGVRLGWGLWSIGGGASGSSSETKVSSDTSTVDVKFEYLRVRIQRPWLAESVFAKRYWTWKATHGFDLLSDGGNLANVPPTRPIGSMPVLPKYLIVARNVELSANFSSHDRTLTTSQLNAGGSVGWGPFRISGSYSENTREEHVQGSFDGTSLRIAHPQVIALTGLLLPRCPFPDRGLPWQGDEVLESDPAVAERIAELRNEDYMDDTVRDYAGEEEAILAAGLARNRSRAAQSAQSRAVAFAREVQEAKAALREDK